MITITEEWVTKCPMGDIILPETAYLTDCEWPWLRWIKDNITDRAFCYFHLLTRRWVVAAWVFAPGEADVPIAKQLTTFTDSPRKPWPSDLSPPKVMKVFTVPFESQYKDSVRCERERLYNKREHRRMEEEERASMGEYLKKKIGHLDPRTLVDWIPRSSDTDTLAKILTGHSS